MGRRWLVALALGLFTIVDVVIGLPPDPDPLPPVCTVTPLIRICFGPDDAPPYELSLLLVLTAVGRGNGGRAALYLSFMDG